MRSLNWDRERMIRRLAKSAEPMPRTQARAEQLARIIEEAKDAQRFGTRYDFNEPTTRAERKLIWNRVFSELRMEQRRAKNRL
ncbi:MAG TPA: hypothetical protein VMY37_38055 [Thermoguttaceae bacterium]|nr:hypothetical protein [Thermoguttaceae bacterium]